MKFESRVEIIGEAIGSEQVIVCGISALECLGLFSGYLESYAVEVYALAEGGNEALDYHVVRSFDGIDTVSCGGFHCTSTNQTINDLLADFDNADELALVESLSNYYHTHGQSFDSLNIEEDNKSAFDSIRESAVMYHCGG